MSHGGDGGIPEEHEEHENHEAWVIPYADLLTLLMAMFIALFAMSTVDTSKFKELAIGFNEALGGGDLDAGIGGAGKTNKPDVVGEGNGEGPFAGGELMQNQEKVTATEMAAAIAQLTGAKAAGDKERQSLKEVQKEINDVAKSLGLGGKVQTKTLDGGLQVTLLTDKVLFAVGKSDVQLEGRELLTLVAGVLQHIDNKFRIVGYTDSQPCVNCGGALDNLQLSSNRANAVYRIFHELGLDRNRMSAVGNEDKNPVGDNRTEAGRALNRRVEIIVESKVKDQVLSDAGLSDNESTESDTTPTTVPLGTVGPGATPSIEPNLGAHGG